MDPIDTSSIDAWVTIESKEIYPDRMFVVHKAKAKQALGGGMHLTVERYIEGDEGERRDSQPSTIQSDKPIDKPAVQWQRRDPNKPLPQPTNIKERGIPFR